LTQIWVETTQHFLECTHTHTAVSVDENRNLSKYIQSSVVNFLSKAMKGAWRMFQWL